jgi:putative RNA 2'-phosphotransferase
MNRLKDRERLRKLIAHILARRPDEFGLVLDDQGCVRLKDLIRAITEEPGFGYVRKSHIQEVLATSTEAALVIEGDKIKAVRDDHGVSRGEETPPPNLLYHCVRRRAYPVVCKHGIRPSGEKRVLLSTTKTMAKRIGMRRDPIPVMLTIQAGKAFGAGIRFFRHGELLYVTHYIPVDFFVGPSLPREKKKEPPKRGKEPVPLPETLPGSVTFDLDRSQALFKPRWKEKGRKKEIGWKRDVRGLKRHRKRDDAKHNRT